MRNKKHTNIIPEEKNIKSNLSDLHHLNQFVIVHCIFMAKQKQKSMQSIEVS